MDKETANLRKQVLEQLDMSVEITDEALMDLIADVVAIASRKTGASIRERLRLEKEIFNSLRRLDVIQELVEDPEVTEIMVNGPCNIFYEKNGKLYRFEKDFGTEEHLQDLLQQIVARHNRVINMSMPLVDTRLMDGSRVNIVLPPIAIDGSVLTIRRFPAEPYTLEMLVGMGTLSQEVAQLLTYLVRAKYSIVISGGTGSGKTTLLNALAQRIPPSERIITIEDSAELQIRGIPNLVRLETRNANLEGVTEIGVRTLIKTALRMRPDRIIVGECRGGEAFDLLQCLNTGHEGSLSSAHANSCAELISRLEMMVLMSGMELPLSAIRGQIASGVDLVVQTARLRDRTRRVIEIAEVCGVKDDKVKLVPLYQFVEEGECDGIIQGSLHKTADLQSTQKLVAAGLCDSNGNFDWN